MERLKNITIGSDIEVFVENNGNLIPASILTKGRKDKPVFFKLNGNKISLHNDNVSLEFAIPPTKSKKEFIEYIINSKDYIEDIIKKNCSNNNLLFDSSIEITEEILINDIYASEFGCSPDMIVEMNFNQLNKHYMNLQWNRHESLIRTTGFHIHLGYDNPDEKTNLELVKMFEKHVTNSFINDDIDPFDRRSLYGEIGSFRHKPYGVEFRSLGGSLMRNSRLIEDVYDCIIMMITLFNNGERCSKNEYLKIKENINNFKKESKCVEYLVGLENQ